MKRESQKRLLCEIHFLMWSILQLLWFLFSVQTPAPVKDLVTTPSQYSAKVTLNIEASESASSYITKVNVYLNGQKHQTVTRGSHYAFNITRLKPYTDYVVGIETEDSSFQRSNKVFKTIKTKEAGIFYKPLLKYQ